MVGREGALETASIELEKTQPAMESADLAHERKSGTRCAASALADVTATMQAVAPASASTQRVLRRTYTYKILTLMILAAILQCSLAFSSSRLQAQQCRDGRALRRDIAALSLKMQSSSDERQQHTQGYCGERTHRFGRKALNVPASSLINTKVSERMSPTASRTALASLTSSTALAMGLSSSPPPYPVRVTVLGGGNFGLALASVLGRKGIPVTLLVRSEDIADELNNNHRHPRYMSDITLPTSIRATADPKTALSDATYVVHSVPVQYSRSFLEDVKEYIPKGVPVLSASKGIETTSLGFMADILRETLGDERSYAFLSGPSFAREICEGVATAVVIASEDVDLTDDFADLFSSENFRVYTSHDVIGVEIGGAVKNVIALAAGMCEGLGLGTNAMSGLVTRGCAEMRRLGLALGARPSTIAGLSGVGDTFGTCFGPLSRNRQFGYRLGKGETMEEILASTTEVAEGVDTAIALRAMIKARLKGYRLDLKYPILFGVADILEGNQTPINGLKGLMNMPIRKEAFERYES